MTVRKDDEVRDRLGRLARSTRRTESFLAEQAMAQFFESDDWLAAQVKAASGEAEAGDVVVSQDVTASTGWRQASLPSPCVGCSPVGDGRVVQDSAAP